MRTLVVAVVAGMLLSGCSTFRETYVDDSGQVRTGWRSASPCVTGYEGDPRCTPRLELYTLPPFK